MAKDCPQKKPNAAIKALERVELPVNDSDSEN
jgi:hypothetical protein